MVAKLYDKNMVFLRPLANLKNIKVVEELKTGYKTLEFAAPFSIGILQEEQKIEVNSYIYVIKEVNIESYDYYTVYCKPYFGELMSKNIDSLVGYGMVLEDCLSSLLENVDWTYKILAPVAGSYTMNLHHMNVYDAIVALKQLFQFDYFFDTKNKVISIWGSRGTKKNTLIIDSKNVRKCKCYSNTHELVTRLIPIGKNNTTINLVNDNSLWVEDFSYTDEIILGYWITSSTENADDLLSLAKNKIKDISQPRTTYTISLSELPADINVGDTIRIIDNLKGIDREQRIQKIVIAKDNPDNSYLEAGKPEVSFDDIYKDFKNAQNIINQDALRNLTELNMSYGGDS